MITVYQIQGQNVPPLADARLYELLSGGGVGVVVGCEITSLGGLQLRIGSGWILIQGRWIAIAEETITVTPSGSGQMDGQLLLHMDVSNTESPGVWITNAQTPLPAPVRENVNGSGTIYELQMCTYKVDQLQVASLQTTFPVLGTAAGYIYKGTFDVDSWTGSGSVSQTAALTPVDGGPPVTSGSTLLACIGTDSTLPAETKDAMAGPAGDIAKAAKALGDNTITVTLDSAPDVDVEIYFSVKQGVEPAVPPLDPVGAGSGMKLLWTNPAPTTSFEPQKVTLPLADYDVVVVTHMSGVGEQFLFPPTIWYKGAAIRSCVLVGNPTFPRMRRFTVEDDGITFASGTSASTTTGTVCVPEAIYGIKL